MWLKISWEQVRCATASSRLLESGDVLFLSDHRTTLSHRNIHAWQKLATLTAYDPDKDYRIYHAAIIAAHPQNPNYLTIAESTMPITRIVSLEDFYQQRANGTLIVFRSRLPLLAYWMGAYGFYFASQKIQYFNVLESLKSCVPTRKFSAHSNTPARFDCGSFVSFIHDEALRTVAKQHPCCPVPTKLMQYREVAPIHLYHEMQHRTQHEHSWCQLYCTEAL